MTVNGTRKKSGPNPSLYPRSRDLGAGLRRSSAPVAVPIRVGHRHHDSRSSARYAKGTAIMTDLHPSEDDTVDVFVGIGVPHIERYLSSRDGSPILVSCDCPIGHDHDYRRWAFEAPSWNAHLLLAINGK